MFEPKNSAALFGHLARLGVDASDRQAVLDALRRASGLSEDMEFGRLEFVGSTERGRSGAGVFFVRHDSPLRSAPEMFVLKVAHVEDLKREWRNFEKLGLANSKSFMAPVRWKRFFVPVPMAPDGISASEPLPPAWGAGRDDGKARLESIARLDTSDELPNDTHNHR